MAPKLAGPKAVIDIQGIIGALETNSNAEKVAVFDAISEGDLWPLKGVREEVEGFGDVLLNQYKAFGPYRYMKVPANAKALANIYAEQCGATIFGQCPPFYCFEVYALCVSKSMNLISHGSHLAYYKKIRKSVDDKVPVLSISDLV